MEEKVNSGQLLLISTDAEIFVGAEQVFVIHSYHPSGGQVQVRRTATGIRSQRPAGRRYQHAIGVPALREPGAAFQYGPSCYYVFGEIMKRKLATRKQTTLDYLKQRILDPIGVKLGDWVHDASGNPHIPNGAHLTASEWMKYGRWLLQDGEWTGKQIVRKDLLHELIKPSDANPGHGLAFWLNQPGGQGAVGVAAQRSEPGDKAGWIYRDGCPDLFAALGAGKCSMYVIPSLKLVALRQGDSDRDRFEDNTFLSLLLAGNASDASVRDVGMPGNKRQAVELFLQRFDRNGDGKIVPNEAGPQLKKSFDFLDKNRDGALDAIRTAVASWSPARWSMSEECLFVK